MGNIEEECATRLCSTGAKGTLVKVQASPIGRCVTMGHVAIVFDNLLTMNTSSLYTATSSRDIERWRELQLPGMIGKRYTNIPDMVINESKQDYLQWASLVSFTWPYGWIGWHQAWHAVRTNAMHTAVALLPTRCHSIVPSFFCVWYIRIGIKEHRLCSLSLIR